VREKKEKMLGKKLSFWVFSFFFDFKVKNKNQRIPGSNLKMDNENEDAVSKNRVGKVWARSLSGSEGRGTAFPHHVSN
jgi:hypothetical protein